MTTLEKRNKLYHWCDTNSECRGCILYNCSRCGKGVHFLSKNCTGYHMSDTEVNEAYDIVFNNKPIDAVNPSHYKDGKIEVIDYIEDKKLGFCLGNAVKYISRAGKKDPSKEVEDLKKAKWYIERRIQELEEAK